LFAQIVIVNNNSIKITNSIAVVLKRQSHFRSWNSIKGCSQSAKTLSSRPISLESFNSNHQNRKLEVKKSKFKVAVQIESAFSPQKFNWSVLGNILRRMTHYIKTDLLVAILHYSGYKLSCPFVSTTICLSTCVSPSICLSVYLSLRLSVSPSICLSVYLSLRLSLRLCLSVYLSLHQCLSVYLSV